MLCSEDAIRSLVSQTVERERLVGITASVLAMAPATAAIVTPLPAVSLKTLYSDFVVRELSPFYKNGEPLVLEDASTTVLASSAVGSAQHDGVVTTALKRPRDDESGDADAIAARLTSVTDAFAPLLDADDLAALVRCIEHGEASVTLNGVADKAKRTALHQAVKAVLGRTHVSSTVEGRFTVARATSADLREQRRRSNPIRTRRFTHFTLYKENLDTNQVFRALAGHLRLSTRQFEFCGTKDKRAVTLQRVAVRDVDPARLASVNTRSFGPQGAVRVCGFREEPHGLRLGDALGNHFRIVLRFHPGAPCTWAAPQLRAMEETLSTIGAVNYFGPQRFGTTRVLTSDVGVRLLQGDYRGAIEKIFASRACIVPEMREVVPLVAAGDFTAAQGRVPFFCHQERDMLRYLAESPKDYLGALQTIPRTLAMLYFHAVQSLLWNRMASRRLAGTSQSGVGRLQPEAGDLVLAAVYERRVARCDEAAVPDAWKVLDGSEHAGGGVGAGKIRALPPVRMLTSDDDLSLFALSDVLLPVPGPDRDLVYPTCAGCTSADYAEAARELGVFDGLLGEEAGSSKNVLLKIFHYHGTYRPLCVRPRRVQLSLRTVPSWRAPVTPTDLEEQQQAAVTSPAPAGEPVSAGEVDEPAEVRALVAELSLPPGSYATSVLREFCVAVSENYHQAAGDEAADEALPASEDPAADDGEQTV